MSSAAVLSGCLGAGGTDPDVFGFDEMQTAAVASGDGAAVGGPTPAAAVPAAQPGGEATGETDADAAGAIRTAAASQAGADIAAPAQTEAPAAAGVEAPERRGPFSAFAMLPGGGQPRQSDRSLYASLFTESAARTPVRNAEANRPARVIVSQRGTAEGSAAGAAPSGDAALPGVDPSSLFEIGQRASADDPDLMEDIGSSYQIASLSGMARLAPNGLLVQRDDIVTNCFGTELVSLLRQVERRFGERVVITSGYRSPEHNRRVRGAKASMHMACKAADLHVPGVSGGEVAKFVRSLPQRGGVGTYCHTAAIHLDVGPKRDWNWACRRQRS